MSETTGGGLSAEERERLDYAVHATDCNFDDVVEQVERIVAARVAATEQDSREWRRVAVDQTRLERDRAEVAEQRAEQIAAAVEALTYASDDGTEYEHNGHPDHEGEPECPACWVAGIRDALAPNVGRVECADCGPVAPEFKAAHDDHHAGSDATLAPNQYDTANAAATAHVDQWREREAAHACDRKGEFDRSICGACGGAFAECSICGTYTCECADALTAEGRTGDGA